MKITSEMKIAEVIKRIVDLPPLEVIEGKEIDPRRAVLCLQSEYGVIDAKKSMKTDPPIEYIGTKELKDCIFVSIQNECQEFFFSHIDSTLSKNLFNFDEFKKPFKELRVTLIGGRVTVGESKITLRNIVRELLELASKFQVTIIGQRILNHNENHEDINKRANIYDLVCLASQTLFLYLYGYRLNTAFFDIKFPGGNCFLEGHKLTETADRQLIGFLFALVKVSGKMPEMTLRMIEQKCPQIRPDVAKASINFYKLLSYVMTPKGYFYLSNTGFNQQTASLSNFVVKLSTGELIRAPQHTPSFREIERRAYSMDGEVPKQFLFYANGYRIIPKFSNTFAKKYLMAKHLIENSEYIQRDHSEHDPRSDMLLDLMYYNKAAEKDPLSLDQHNVSLLKNFFAAFWAKQCKPISSEVTDVIISYSIGK